MSCTPAPAVNTYNTKDKISAALRRTSNTKTWQIADAHARTNAAHFNTMWKAK